MTTVTIENTKILVKTASDFMLPIIILTVIFVNLFAAIAVIVLTVFTSHRIAGPLFRIKREIELLKNGDLNANFRIRKTDQLQELATILAELADSLRDRYLLLKDKTLQLKNIVKTSPKDSDAINSRLKELEDILSQVKV
jgi:methyl-accepting chemotaxis protein